MRQIMTTKTTYKKWLQKRAANWVYQKVTTPIVTKGGVTKT